jgi:glycosyltransferase involved in cell wall biosynthesis
MCIWQKSRTEVSTPVVYLVSAKFAPGLMKEFGLLGVSLESRGVRVRYLLARPYQSMGWDHPDTRYITASVSSRGTLLDTVRATQAGNVARLFPERPAALYFYNTHPLNPLLARDVRRRFPGTAVVLHLHDPYKPDKTAYGRRGALRIRIVEFVQRLTVRQADHIVFPSDYSRQLFQSRYRRFCGATHVAPLLIPDRPDGVAPPRACFSMVGRMHRATGHDTFRELVNYAAGKGLAHQFALVCSNDLSKYLSQVVPQGRKSLRVISHRLIGDAVIDAVMQESYASLRLAKEVTQSGVVPVAYRNYTPVIARDIPGLRQHVRHEHNGYLVPADCGPGHLVEAMEYVRANFARLSTNARRSYEEIWSERNWDKYYDWLMRMLEGHATAYSES